MVLGVIMTSVKELKSIDLNSFTIIGTGITVLISALISILIAIGIVITSPGNASISIYIIPTIIVGSFICGIYQYFSNGLFYNFLSKKFRNINVAFDNESLVKISTTETATIIATITLIQVLLTYLVSVLILPLVINATIQTLMLGGQQLMAYSLYQFLLVLSQPITIITLIFGSFIITFVFVLIGAYIYNLIASKGRAITLKLSFGIIMVISGANMMTLITDVCGGVVYGFIAAALTAAAYNILAPKIGKLKIELIDL